MSESLVEGEQSHYFPETQFIINLLSEDAALAFDCDQGDGPAVAILEVPGGCVALPGLETQALCPQHIITDGSFEGMGMIIDLSQNAAWSRSRGETPDYWIEVGADGVAVMHATAETPLPE